MLIIIVLLKDLSYTCTYAILVAKLFKIHITQWDIISAEG